MISDMLNELNEKLLTAKDDDGSPQSPFSPHTRQQLVKSSRKMIDLFLEDARYSSFYAGDIKTRLCDLSVRMKASSPDIEGLQSEIHAIIPELKKIEEGVIAFPASHRNIRQPSVWS